MSITSPNGAISQYVEKLASYAIIILKNCEIHEEA